MKTRRYDTLIPGYVREKLAYCPECGSFLWRPRPTEGFNSAREHASWNAKHAGKPAGSYNKLSGQMQITLGGSTYPSKVLAYIYMTGKHPKGRIVPRNGDKLDLSWQNIRPEREAAESELEAA